jgi:hypothetical protein
VSYGVTAHGDPNTAADATLNVPLIQDRLALRAVLYNDKRGGYIDNVPSTFTRRNTDVGISYAGGSVPDNSPVINNNNLVQNAINPVSYQRRSPAGALAGQPRLGSVAVGERPDHQRPGRVLSNALRFGWTEVTGSLGHRL